MADKDSSDLLMTVKPKGKLALEGEATTTFDKNDDLMQNFLPQRFCEIQEFSFGAGINDGESSEPGSTGHTEEMQDNDLHGKDGSRPQGGKSSKKGTRARSRKFRYFVETGMLPPSSDDPNRAGYEMALEEITISRQMDRMSVPLIKLWFDQTPLDYIIVVKRKFTGNKEYHEAFLRIQFSEALITDIDWKDGDTISETLKFVYRGATIAYKPQKSDGTLAKAISVPVSYDMAPV